jgi:hypothetical protein
MELNKNNFVEDLSNNIGRIIIENTHPLLYGSSSSTPASKRLIWKGDIDLLTVIENKNKNKAYDKIKNILKSLKKIKDGSIIIGEIKFGEEIDIKKKIEDLTKTKASTIKNYKEIENMADSKGVKIKKLKNNKITESDYFNIKDELRDLYILRWNANDILEGKADKYLDQENPIFKIDFECWTGSNYIECSNYIVLGESASDEEFSKSLKDNIKKTLYVNTNYYKVLKRLYSYYRSIDNQKMIDELINIINSPQLGALYSIISQLKVLELVDEYGLKNNATKAKIKKSLDYLKWYTQYLDQQDKLNLVIDKLKKKFDVEALDVLRLNLMDQLNKETLKIYSLNKINNIVKKI